MNREKAFTAKGFESAFFSTFEGWDLLDTAYFAFYGAVSCVPLGNFPIGTRFDLAEFSLDAMELTLQVSAKCEEGEESEKVILPMKLALA